MAESRQIDLQKEDRGDCECDCHVAHRRAPGDRGGKDLGGQAMRWGEKGHRMAGAEIRPSPCRLSAHEAVSGHLFLLLTSTVGPDCSPRAAEGSSKSPIGATTVVLDLSNQVPDFRKACP